MGLQGRAGGRARQARRVCMRARGWVGEAWWTEAHSQSSSREPCRRSCLVAHRTTALQRHHKTSGRPRRKCTRLHPPTHPPTNQPINQCLSRLPPPRPSADVTYMLLTRAGGIALGLLVSVVLAILVLPKSASMEAVHK